jgi:hypothetical protein
MRYFWLALSLVAAPCAAQVTIPDTPTSNSSTVARSSDPSFSHTVTSGTTLVLAIACGDGHAAHNVNGVTGAGVTWSEVYVDDDSTNAASAAQEIWGAVSPDVGATTVAVDYSSHSTVDGDYIAVVNVKGTVTTNVAAAIQLLSEDLNNADGSAGVTSQTSVHASGGTGGNHLLFTGCQIGAGGSGGTNDASFVELLDANTGGGANSALDKSILVAHKAAPSAITHTWSRDDDNVSGLFELVAAVSDGEFDVAAMVMAQSTTAYTITGSLDAAGTVDGVACLKDQTAPTIAQVQAGDCTGDVAAEATDTDSPSTGDFDFSLTLTPADSFPVYDLYVTDGTNLTTLADEFLDPPSTCGENSDELCQFLSLTSVAGTSPIFDFNDAVTPDIASPDVVIAPTTTQPGDFALTIEADGDFEYPGDDSRQSAQNISFYDVSAEDYHADTLDFWDHDVAIDCDDNVEILIFDEDSLPASIDLDDDCTDESQPTYAVTGGTLHTGFTLTGATGVLSFTYSTEDEAGDSITFTATGEAGDTDTLVRDIYVVDTFTAPTITGANYVDADDTIMGAAPWYGDNLSITFDFVCDEVVAEDIIISQIPVASSEVEEPLQAWSATVSTGPCALLKRRRR